VADLIPDPPTPDPESIAEAVRRLGRGEPVAFPTETVYGLGADATDAKAVARVFEIKGRPSTNPLIVHVTGPEMARRVVAEWSDDAGKLADEFWPGPLSLVLPKNDTVPDIVTAGGPTVAVRAPRHPAALALLEAFGKPLVGPSANPSGAVSPTTAAHVRASWTEAEVYVIDGGPCTIGIESTVLGLHTAAPHPPAILRPGAISAAQLGTCLGREVSPFDATANLGSPVASPGLRHAHYKPRAPVVVNPADSVDREAVLVLPPEPLAAAASLYAMLRRADEHGPSRIVVRYDEHAIGTDPLWDAIFDRLRRASASS
jgi:L-threonylcarbamoyladenylate synthase